jgi:hypothetical protein
MGPSLKSCSAEIDEEEIYSPANIFTGIVAAILIFLLQFVNR